MTSRELLRAMYAEGVEPDDPTPAVKAEFAGTENLELGCVFVSDRQPEGSGWFQDPDNSFDPLSRPVDILGAFPAVVVNVVIVANIEGRVGERQIDRFCREA